jgi:hypothetical protein
MASRKPYECFRCRDNGFPNTMVYLAGKDEQGKTIQLEEDGTAHRHKSKEKGQPKQQPAQQQSTGSAAAATIMTENIAMKIINAKLDRIINILEQK